jgi:signal transduction histidine kinase
MSREHPSMVMLVSYLRWVIPLAIGLIGVGYILLEQVVFQGHPLFSPDVVRTAIVIELMGPALAWLILSWAKKLAVAEADAQQELAFRNRELVALNAIGDVTSQSLNLDEILRAALEKMVELMGLQAGEMRVVEGDRLILKAHYGVSQTKIEEPAVRLGQCLCGTCAQAGKTLTTDNLPSEPSLANLPCAKEGFRSIINIPMKAKGQVLGVILLASRNQSTIDFADRQILNAIGYRVAMAIENAQLYKKAYRLAIHLETASLVGQRISALLDLDSLLAEVVRLIREKFGYYHVHIFIEDEEAGEVILKVANGPSANLKAQGLRFKIGQEGGIIGWVAHSGQTVLCNDVSREPRYYAIDHAPSTKSELTVPLRVGDQIIGVLDVQSNRLDAFDKEDVTALQILGNQICVAIENARLFQETKHRYDAMIALHETSLDVIAQLDTPRLLQALLRRGSQLLDAQAGSFYLYDAEEKSIHNIANYNTERDWTGVAVRLGEGAIGQVVLTGEPLIINDYENWKGRAEVFSGDSLRRIISVPLNWQGQVIGGLNISNQLEKRPFDQNDLWILSQFADLASLAIKNAELHTQVKEFSQGLELKVKERTEELSRARDEIEVKAEQLRSLLAKTIKIQEEERARIALDMHDGVIQMISAARYELQAAEVLTGSEMPTTAKEKFKTTYQILEEMEKEIRRDIYDLHPPILDVVGLAPALQKYIRSFQEISGITCEMQVKGMPYRLPLATEIAIFRIAEEALQNVAAHSNAKAVSVTMDYEPTLLGVSVQDNGLGFDYKEWIKGRNDNHLGLVGMQERIENLGGRIEVSSETGQGTRVLFQLPVVPDEDYP